MRPDNSHYLHAAQQRRRQELTERATASIRALDLQGERVSFASVVRASGVSRSFVNKVPELVSEIRRLRDARPATVPRVPSGQRMSDESKDARMAQVSEANRRLREEIAWLKEQNAVLLGTLRLNGGTGS
ncbi:MAG: DUF6262 family protein [Actinobacteria bacterium]|nr:DUF6262 family protein [Actinomycetota bacterium]